MVSYCVNRPALSLAGTRRRYLLDMTNSQELIRQQTVLARFGQLALQSEDLDDILNEACHLSREALGTDLAKVIELQEDGTTLRVRAGVGWKPGVVGSTVIKAADNTSEGYALKTGKAVISPDIAEETRFRYPDFLLDHGVRGFSNVVISGGKDKPPFGILQVDSCTPRKFTEGDTNFLTSYANLLAAAVDRLRVASEMRDSKDRLRLALDAGELGSWELNLATGTASSSPQHDLIFGYSDLMPAWGYDVFLEHVLPEDREHVASAFRRAMNAGLEWHFECRIRRANDDEVRWIEAHGRHAGRGRDGGATYLLGTVADITARKATEEALRHSNQVLEARVAERTRELMEANAKLRAEAEERQRIEEALRQSQKMEAVGQLTGGLAHDFNNLLTGVMGSLELLQTRIAQGRIKDADRYVNAAQGAAKRAAALTHRLLAFSRRQTLDPKPTDVSRLVQGMEDMIRSTIGPSINFKPMAVAGKLWPTFVDSGQLENALLNLCINARDAMPDGGKLTIETSNCWLDERSAREHDLPPGHYVSLCVSDTGTGMTPEVITKAFDPFFTTKPIGMGTGLGLSMIYGFTQQSGGQARICSEVGQGTMVCLYLPRHLGEAHVEELTLELADAPRAGVGQTVLVVDDEPTVRMLVTEVLEDLGYQAIEAADGAAALQVLRSDRRIDLLVTDVGLSGGMNGRQVADAARVLRAKLEVLFITGYAENAVLRQGHLDSGMHILTKPFAMEALVRRIKELIDTPKR